MRVSSARLRRAISGVEASQLFAAHRRVLLEDLASNAHDKSLAGRVDPQIRSLVCFLNDRFEQYVTTSSCSGRIALFHRGKMEDDVLAKAGERRREAPRNVEGSQSASKTRKRGGFGLGTLFQSHDPLPDVEATVRDSLAPALSRFWQWRQTLPLVTPLSRESELLQLKFEPMILHILCRDVEAAAALLQCASESAQGNSGIVSCSRGTHEYRKITCCVTSPVAFDIPLFSNGAWLLPTPHAADGGFLSDPVWRELLTNAVARANTLFAENANRTLRFWRVLTERELPAAAQRSLEEPSISQRESVDGAGDLPSTDARP